MCVGAVGSRFDTFAGFAKLTGFWTSIVRLPNRSIKLADCGMNAMVSLVTRAP